jgi:hypothetical protein
MTHISSYYGALLPCYQLTTYDMVQLHAPWPVGITQQQQKPYHLSSEPGCGAGDLMPVCSRPVLYIARDEFWSAIETV